MARRPDPPRACEVRVFSVETALASVRGAALDVTSRRPPLSLRGFQLVRVFHRGQGASESRVCPPSILLVIVRPTVGAAAGRAASLDDFAGVVCFLQALPCVPRICAPRSACCSC